MAQKENGSDQNAAEVKSSEISVLKMQGMQRTAKTVINVDSVR